MKIRSVFKSKAVEAGERAQRLEHVRTQTRCPST